MQGEEVSGREPGNSAVCEAVDCRAVQRVGKTKWITASHVLGGRDTGASGILFLQLFGNTNMSSHKTNQEMGIMVVGGDDPSESQWW